MSATPELHWLTEDETYKDYRPAISSDGKTVIFERTLASGEGPTTLYKIADITASKREPVPFLSGLRVPRSQTRPDVCWRTGKVAFNGPRTDAPGLWIWQVGADGANPDYIGNTQGCQYPTWGPDGDLLVAMNGGPFATPSPCSTVFDTEGFVPKMHANINGKDRAGTEVYGGMPAVTNAGMPWIAFAGQPATPGWGILDPEAPKPDKASYDQEKNYIFFNAHHLSPDDPLFTCEPMERDASIYRYKPERQGRAPACSPNGRTIAFESNRDGGYAIYLCDLRNRRSVAVTDPALDGQHAKLFPDGSKLVLAIRKRAGAPRHIVWVDISGLLKP